MYKYILFIFIIISAALHAKESELYYSPEYKKAMIAIQSLEEGEELINTVLEEGEVWVVRGTSHSKNFEAYWNAFRREIYVVPSRNQSLGKQISSILFELHNAKSSCTIKELCNLARNGEIDRENFARSFEYMEFCNYLSTSKIINRGIQLGFFPKDTDWVISEDFDTYLEIQKKTGHTRWIEKIFDNISLCS